MLMVYVYERFMLYIINAKKVCGTQAAQCGQLSSLFLLFVPTPHRNALFN